MKTFLHLIFAVLVGLPGIVKSQQNNIVSLLAKKRLIVIMFDGFGMSYYKNAPMPHLQSLVKKGFFKEVKALTPTVTNANNASICCGTFPDQNGITGNSFLAPDGKEAYMEDKSLLLSPTIFEKLKKYQIKSALIASKKKSIGLLAKGSEIAISPETADSNWIKSIGIPPSIYSSDVNYWTMSAALNILKNRPEIRCIYIHTTDYPMHMWAPEDSNSIKHLMAMDKYLNEISKIAPDAMLLITADHDVNHKNRCVDLERSLIAKNVKIKIAISTERDKYLKHHRGFGGTSYIYLKKSGDETAVKKNLLEIEGVKSVTTRKEAAQRFHLMASRIGDLVAFADSTTVFGNLENTMSEILPANYRTHGSEYELRVPLFVLNAEGVPAPSYFQFNKDLTTWLFK